MSSETKKLRAAFENPKYKWRTIKGVAKETGLSRESVKTYVTDHGEYIVRSSVRNTKGEQLFASRQVYRNKAGIFRRITSGIKNRGG